MNSRELATCYREALKLLFGTDIAHKTQTRYWESEKGRKRNYWVNRPKRTDDGLVFSPTGWRSYTPEELQEEAERFARESITDDTKRGE